MWKWILAAAAAAAAAVGLWLRSEYEKKHFVTETYTVKTDKIEQGELHFVFLSDLHNNTFGPENEALIAAIDRIHPDGVLIGGDLIVCRKSVEVEAGLHLAKALAKRYPVYYANGNHEDRMNRRRDRYGDQYDRFLSALKGAGVHCLSDESMMGPGKVCITGCGLDEEQYRHRFTLPKLSPGELRRRVGEADSEYFQILMLHSPLFFDECRRWGADLTLSGHFHGGTVRLPFFGGLMTPQYQFFQPWCAGRFDRDGKTMLVSRGLGTHSINVRLNNRPQLIDIRLSKKE